MRTAGSLRGLAAAAAATAARCSGDCGEISMRKVGAAGRR